MTNADMDYEKNWEQSVQYVKDRPGHDRRYAIDAGKIQRELGRKDDKNNETDDLKRKTAELTVPTTPVTVKRRTVRVAGEPSIRNCVSAPKLAA